MLAFRRQIEDNRLQTTNEISFAVSFLEQPGTRSQLPIEIKPHCHNRRVVVGIAADWRREDVPTPGTAVDHYDVITRPDSHGAVAGSSDVMVAFLIDSVHLLIER